MGTMTSKARSDDVRTITERPNSILRLERLIERLELDDDDARPRMNRRSQAILGPFAQKHHKEKHHKEKHHKEATSLKEEGDNALISDVEEAGEASKLVCTSKVSEPKLVSESVEVDRFRLAILGCIRSFVIKERRTRKVGSEGGQVNLKSTGVTVTLPEDAVKKKTDIMVTSYLPEDYTESPELTFVTTVLPHGLTLRKKASIELRHHLCLEKPFRVRILYRSGLPTCDEEFHLLADLNQGKRSTVNGETEVRVESNCIRILCRGFSEYCTIKEGYFSISLRIYAPLAFTEGESKGNVVASLSCQCPDVTQKMDKDQRESTDEPKKCKYFLSDYVSVDSMDEVELSVDPPQGTAALYSVSGKLSHSIPATALKLLIGEEHMKSSITRSFFLERRDSSKTISVNFTFKKKLTGSTVPFCIVMWRPMPRPGNLMLLSNGRPETHNEPIQRELQDHVFVMSRTAGDWLDQVVSSEERLCVAKQIGRHWRHVGETLGPEPKFTTIDLDDFQAKGSDRDRAQEMLTTWADKHHKNATKRMLILALKEENRKALISEVFKCNPDSVTEQPPFPLHYSEGTDV